MSRKDAIFSGVKAAVPVILGYLPVGAAYGILAVRNGFTVPFTVLMSVIVFAGSSQLIGINMLGSGAGFFPVVIMTLLVNLRHVLMSAALSLHFKDTEKRLLPLIGFVVTDESFAVSSAGINGIKNKDAYFLGLGFTSYLGWVVSSWLGAGLGTVLAGVNLPGLDFVLPAMFIALLILQIKGRIDILVALAAGFLSLVFIFLFPGNWNIILATVIAATLGVVLERWK